ncbi:MAG: SDR family NAD(P)-dependent oxidoreductase, partial [Chloroflexota bacterium]
MTVRDSFDLSGRVAIITGGAGLLGMKHAEAVAELGGIPVLVDISAERAASGAGRLADAYGKALGIGIDITEPEQVGEILARTLDAFGRADILINNAANNP